MTTKYLSRRAVDQALSKLREICGGFENARAHRVGNSIYVTAGWQAVANTEEVENGLRLVDHNGGQSWILPFQKRGR